MRASAKEAVYANREPQERRIGGYHIAVDSVESLWMWEAALLLFSRGEPVIG